MARPRSAPDLHLLGKVSTLYYLQNETQQQIADRLGLSRPTVSRLITEAKQHGIVRITITAPEGLHLDLEQALEARYPIEEAHVVSIDPGTSDDLLRWQLGAAGAAYLARVIQPRQSIGLAWGTTLSAMVQAVSPMPTQDVNIVQMLGGIGPPDAEAYAAGIVRRLAQVLGASTVLLPAPGVVATAQVRDALRSDPHVHAAIKQFESLDVAFVGIGSIASNTVLSDAHSLPKGMRKALIAAGAVGDVALRFFDTRGAEVQTPLDERTLGITAEQLRKVPRVVAVAGGAEKHDAIRAALASGMIDVLITDRETAEAMR